jgi:hypothetical protein
MPGPLWGSMPICGHGCQSPFRIQGAHGTLVVAIRNAAHENGADAASLPEVARPEGRALTADPFDTAAGLTGLAPGSPVAPVWARPAHVDGHQAP